MRPSEPSDCDEVVRPGSFTVVDDAASAVVVALFASAEVFAAALVLSAAVDVRMSGWLTPAVSVNAGRLDLAAIAGEETTEVVKVREGVRLRIRIQFENHASAEPVFDSTANSACTGSSDLKAVERRSRQLVSGIGFRSW